jgi:hypothetical protein
MREFLRKWLTEPPDSLYSRTTGAVVRTSECRAIKLQVIAAEALVEYADPAADSLIAALLQQGGNDCSLCARRLPDTRFLEMARLRLAGNGLGAVFVEGKDDTLRCARDLATVRSALLCESTPSAARVQGIPPETLQSVFAQLQWTLRGSEHETNARGDLTDASPILTLHFQDDIKATLTPLGLDRVRYEDDSYCHGLRMELVDAQLNKVLRDLPHEVKSLIRVPGIRAASEKP